MKSENLTSWSDFRHYSATAVCIIVMCTLITACADVHPAAIQDDNQSNNGDEGKTESSVLNLDRLAIEPLGIAEDPYDPGSGDYYYAYNITNTSDQDVEYIDLDLNIMDKKGNVLDDTFIPYPHTLAPGETALMDDFLWESDSLDLTQVYALIINDIAYKESETQEEYIIPLTEEEQRSTTIYLKDVIPYDGLQEGHTDQANL